MTVAQSDQEIVQQFSGLGWEDWLLAGVVLVVGLIISRLLGRAVRKAVSKTGVSEFVATILGRLAATVAVVLTFSFALQAIGVSIGPLVGALGIAGLALALAFQDILENVVAGVLMLMRRPIGIGDEVMTNGFDGTVQDITLRAVELTTLDGETVYIPNALVWKNPLTNITNRTSRRSRIDVGVAYDTDLDRAKSVLENAVATTEGVRESPPPSALVYEFGDSSINFAVFFWHDSPTGTRWRLQDEAARTIKRALDQAGIEIPFPQRVVHTSRREPDS